MCTNLHVVADLHQVVQLDPIGNHCVLQGAAVNAGVGADFDIVADAHRAKLLYLFPSTAVRGKAEAIGTDHHARMNQAALADMAVLRHRHARTQFSGGAHRGAAFDHA